MSINNITHHELDNSKQDPAVKGQICDTVEYLPPKFIYREASTHCKPEVDRLISSTS